MIRSAARPVVKRFPAHISRATIATRYHLAPVYIPSAVGLNATRSFSTALPRYASLTTKPTDVKAGKGTEGSHKSKFPRSLPLLPRLTFFTEDVTATISEESTDVPSVVKGDWVLFHPVYSPSELKAVEVSSIAFYSR